MVNNQINTLLGIMSECMTSRLIAKVEKFKPLDGKNLSRALIMGVAEVCLLDENDFKIPPYQRPLICYLNKIKKPRRIP